MSNVLQEVSRVRSISHPKVRVERRDKPRKLDPNYIIGFIDGEGCFSVSVSRHSTLKRRLEIRSAFEIELRADDREILERIRETIGCGNIYHLAYQRYNWYPHVKLKVSRIGDLAKIVIPFIDRYPLQAKKAEVFKLFREAVFAVQRKKHLTDQGFAEILEIKRKISILNKKHFVEPPGYGKTVRPVA